jgi:hypothetical protein
VSGGSGEFGEECWESVVRVEVDGQLVVSAAQVLHERTSSADYSCAAEPFEATHHRPLSGFQAAVIQASNRIVLILLGDVVSRGQQLIEHSWIRRSPVGVHFQSVSANPDRGGPLIASPTAGTG